jgi:Tfp pilus assembly protein PilE
MRSAFTFIELIFAIVIIAITIISLPMMNQAISKGIDENLVQEAIFASEATLSEANTYAWDENSLNDVSLSSYSRIINFNNECNASTHKRKGNINRRCLTNLALGLSPLVNGQLYAVDPSNFAGPLYTDTSGANVTGSANGYKQTDYNISLGITTPVAFGTAPTNDMKKLSVQVRDNATGNTIVKLSSYIANIGEVPYYHKGML